MNESCPGMTDKWENVINIQTHEETVFSKQKHTHAYKQKNPIFLSHNVKIQKHFWLDFALIGTNIWIDVFF